MTGRKRCDESGRTPQPDLPDGEIPPDDLDDDDGPLEPARGLALEPWTAQGEAGLPPDDLPDFGPPVPNSSTGDAPDTHDGDDGGVRAALQPPNDVPPTGSPATPTHAGRPFLKVPTVLIRTPVSKLGLRPVDLAVLLNLLSWTSRSGRTCFRSVSDLAADTGFARSTVQLSLRRLRGRCIEVVERGGRSRARGPAATLYSAAPFDRLVAELEREAAEVAGRRTGGVPIPGTGVPAFGTAAYRDSVQRCTDSRAPEFGIRRRTENEEPRAAATGGEADASGEGGPEGATPGWASSTDRASTSAVMDSSVNPDLALPVPGSSSDVGSALRHYVSLMRSVRKLPVADGMTRADVASLRAWARAKEPAFVFEMLERFVRDDDPFLRRNGWALRLLPHRALGYVAESTVSAEARIQDAWTGQESGPVMLALPQTEGDDE